MSFIIDIITSYLPHKHKKTPSGWISFNAVCCPHNGNSTDTRGRGGLIVTTDSVSYHCFNCGFKATWQIGWALGTKFKKLLHWLNVPDDLITKCAFDALKTKEEFDADPIRKLMPTFGERKLPLGAKPVIEWIEHDPPEQIFPVLEYLHNRNLFVDDYPWYWTDEPGFQSRLIIPFYYKEIIVGYTARLVRPGKPKYISEQQPGYVFNLDNQITDRKYVFVCEGPIDAISIDCVAVMSNDISGSQHLLLSQLQKQIIVVPDRDDAGKLLIKKALDYNWGVSFPVWDSGVKDINDSVKKYGRLYTLLNIVENIQTNPVKIQLIEKTWFKKEIT